MTEKVFPSWVAVHNWFLGIRINGTGKNGI